MYPNKNNAWNCSCLLHQKNMMPSKSMGRCWPDLLRRVRLFKCHGYTNSVISEGGKNLSAWVVFKRFLLMEQSGDVLSGVIHIWHQALALSSLTCTQPQNIHVKLSADLSHFNHFSTKTLQTKPLLDIKVHNSSSLKIPLLDSRSSTTLNRRNYGSDMTSSSPCRRVASRA